MILDVLFGQLPKKRKFNFNMLNLDSTEFFKKNSGITNEQKKNFGPDKADWLLSNPENIKKLDKEKYELIKSELDKMTKDYKNKIEFDRFYQKKSIQTNTREYMTNRQKDAYASALLGIRNPNQYQAEVLKNQYTSYKTTENEIISNRRITMNKDLKTEQPEWADIVKYLGGYSELIKLGISKDDIPKFKIKKKLESIELTGKNTCLAHIRIEGEEKYGLKYYGIQKTNYAYNGSYEIDDNIDFATIYRMAESTPNINIKFKFAKHNHLPPIDMVVSLSSIGKEWGSMATPYRDIMVQMINDMISDEEFGRIDDVIAYRNSMEEKEKLRLQKEKLDLEEKQDWKKLEAAKKLAQKIYGYVIREYNDSWVYPVCGGDNGYCTRFTDDNSYGAIRFNEYGWKISYYDSGGYRFVLWHMSNDPTLVVVYVTDSQREKYNIYLTSRYNPYTKISGYGLSQRILHDASAPASGGGIVPLLTKK